MALPSKNSEEELEVLRNIESNPRLTQRQMAKELGVSLGKTNYIVNALLDKGFLKVNNFRKSDNKLGYLYSITPKGFEKRRKLTSLFLERKAIEFDKLKEELERLNTR